MALDIRSGLEHDDILLDCFKKYLNDDGLVEIQFAYDNRKYNPHHFESSFYKPTAQALVYQAIKIHGRSVEETRAAYYRMINNTERNTIGLIALEKAPEFIDRQYEMDHINPKEKEYWNLVTKRDGVNNKWIDGMVLYWFFPADHPKPDNAKNPFKGLMNKLEPLTF